jgi:predicted TIM-barrel fold metal-dependent hydrolase
MAAGPYDFPGLDDKPSSYFHRQMYLTFVSDQRGLEHRQELGVDRIMWSTDFPHPATTWPNSQSIVEKDFAGIPETERDLMVAGNASRLYGL